MNRRFAFSLLVVLALAGGAMHPARVLAADTSNPIKFAPETPFPGYDKTQTIDNNGIATYIRAIFIYFIWTVGILAVVMITYGGIRWVAAAGNASRINEARSTINNALIGLIIALTSYTLLYIINPDLLNLSLPTVGTVQTQYYAGLPVIDFCNPADETHEECGDLTPIGKAYDATGAAQTTYCISTRCPLNSSGRVQVCSLKSIPITSGQLRSDATGFATTYGTYYSPDQGCVTQVPVTTAAATYGQNPVLSVLDFQTCGIARGKSGGTIEQLSVGGDCHEPGTEKYHSCYVLNLPANLDIGSGGSADHVHNMTCNL